MIEHKHRYIDTSFWDDAYIMKCDPSEKLLFMYLLTNPLTNICGVYQIELRRITFDTGFEQATVLHILSRFERDDKCVYRDGWLAMKNWIKHQTTSPKVERGIELQLQSVPENLAGYVNGGPKPDRVSDETDTVSYLNSNSNSNLTPVSTPAAPKRKTASVPLINFDFATELWENIADAQVDKWQDTYPATNVERELKKMAEWLLSNPTKRKKNYRRFITNWLERTQERGKG